MTDLIEVSIRDGVTESLASEVGYDSSRLKQLNSHFSELIQAGEVQGASYLLARQGRIFAWSAMGRLRHDDEHRELLPDSIRKVYSITKLFTAVALMQQVEAGKIRLDQPVCEFLEPFRTPVHQEITVFHLLTHTSGIYADPGYFNEPYDRGWYEWLPGDGDWICNVLAGPLSCKPGTEWVYSSAAYAILGEIIGKVSGIPFERYVIEKIAEPLGMNDTHFEVPESLCDRVAWMQEWEEKELYSPMDRTGKPPRAGNGLYSTLSDLFIFGQMMLNKGSWKGVRILGPKTVDSMTRNHLTNVSAYHWGDLKSNISYGLGVSLRDRLGSIISPNAYNHEGFGRSALYIDPDEQFLAVYFVPMSGFSMKAVVHPRSIMWSGLL